mgnify:CR=1 FL=1
MIEIRPFATLGGRDHGWLKARHHFSFGDYHDPARMGWGRLRVWNDDEIKPGNGFAPHGHRDMEIVTYIREGAITHRDNMGNEGRTEAGDVQIMSAGTGVVHSEYNHEPGVTKLFQIWILPDRKGVAPGYEERAFSEADKRGRLRLVASPDGADGSVSMHQDARVYAGLFDGEEHAEHALAPGRRAWVHVARGAVRVNGEALSEGDAAAIEDEASIVIDGGKGAEVLLFDLP